MKVRKTNRGFSIANFIDRNGNECSLQKSSIATENCIWLGVNDVKPQIMASDAKKLGIETKETTGWIPYPVPKEVLFTDRMHLTQAQVRHLLPHLIKFAESGEIK